MDVGQDNFRFTLDDTEKRSKAVRYPMSAELHVNSLDRIITKQPPFTPFLNPSQAFAQLTPYIGNVNLPSTDCLIKTKRALLYGYFNRIGMSELQLNYCVPTIVTKQNDLLNMVVFIGNNPSAPTTNYITIPLGTGHYTAKELASVLQTAIRASGGGGAPYATYTVTPPINQQDDPTVLTNYNGFEFSTNNSDTWAFSFKDTLATELSFSDQLRAAKFNRLLGVGRQASGYSPLDYSPQGQVPIQNLYTNCPNWLQTDYVDIVSKSLTNYKETKDTNTNVQAPLGVIGRIYLTDFANAPIGPVWNNISSATAWGSAPFRFTKKWMTVNWSQWSPNQSIDQIDIQLLDMWGEVLYWTTEFPTEWEMTLVASE